MDEALKDVEQEFLIDSTRPTPCSDHEIIEGHLYLAAQKVPIVENLNQFDYHAFRVYVVEIDRIQKRALFFHIDNGLTEWLEYESKLFHLNRNLLEYPAQAIHFSLSDLDEFQENAFAYEQTQLQLLGKNFFAKVKITQEEFENQLESGDSDNPISVVLLDKSTGKGRNVNKSLLEMLRKNSESPGNLY